jgi:3-oxoacyl-[acyl-carrier-protein] synthase-3
VAHLLGFGAALPERVVSNDELAEELGVTPEWIVSVSGIEERRRAAVGETPAVLAHSAAGAGLAAAGLAPGDLGAIVVGTGSSPRSFPGVSADLQRLLGAPGIPAFDVPLASAGGLFALALAVDLAPRYGPVLVAGAEVMSTVLDRPPRAKETAVLFGDGAGCCVVAPGDGAVGVVDVRIGSDGSLADDLSLAPGGPLTMNGRTVILQASRKLPQAVRDVTARNGVAVDEIDLFVFHQANLVLLRQVAKSLGVPEEKLLLQVARYGNTSAASVLIALAEAHATGRLSPGTQAVVAAFGAGFSWGAALLRSAAGVVEARTGWEAAKESRAVRRTGPGSA